MGPSGLEAGRGGVLQVGMGEVGRGGVNRRWWRRRRMWERKPICGDAPAQVGLDRSGQAFA